MLLADPVPDLAGVRGHVSAELEANAADGVGGVGVEREHVVVEAVLGVEGDPVLGVREQVGVLEGEGHVFGY